jgi:hypothetical protein
MGDFLKYADKLKQEIDILLARYTTGCNYPGKKTLQDGKSLLISILQNQFTIEFFNTVYLKKDDLLDLADDYEPIKKFFNGEQIRIFEKAGKYLSIYEESKTYIANKKIEDITESIRNIVKSSSPYGQIHKLPDLLNEFATLNVALLSDMAEPILKAVEESKTRVFEVLKGKLCEIKLKDKYINSFSALREKAKTCNNVAKLQNIKVEADTLKIRCLNEIDIEEARLTPKPEPNDNGKTPAPVVPIKKRKNVSIKTLNHEVSWEIETAADIEKYLSGLKTQLLKQLEDDTVIRIEF